MAKLIATNWEDIWGADEFSVYGSVTVQTTGTGNYWITIGVCVGVPEYQRSTARAAGRWDALLDAWFEDSSDWQNASHTFRKGTEQVVGRLALEACKRAAKELYDDAAEGLS